MIIFTPSEIAVLEKFLITKLESSQGVWIAKLRKKMKLDTREEIVAYALLNGIISLDGETWY